MATHNFERAAVIGAGTIGLSWAVLFAAHGLEVFVTDPRDDLADLVAGGIEDFGPQLAELGLDVSGLDARIKVTGSLEEAVAHADVVQENAPEKLELKQSIYRQVFTAAPAHAIILSSTSNTTATKLAEGVRGGERILVGHPLNPPHLVPSVEVVPGEQTSADTVERAVAFYEKVGRKPVVEHKEVTAFVLTALQYALLDKARELLLDGVVSPQELDALVRNGLGLRWASVGPFEAVHLGGGPGGIRHLGTYADTSSQKNADRGDRVVEAVEGAYGLDHLKERAAVRDARQIAILNALRDEPAYDDISK